MRVNKFVAAASYLSRRSADKAIVSGRVAINDSRASLGDHVNEIDQVTLDGEVLHITPNFCYIMINKPTGFVCSRNEQGNKTIYELLPPKYHNLNPVGRLDKNSSGLLLLTDDGEFVNRLTHPRYGKNKLYIIKLDKVLSPDHQKLISIEGIKLEDGLSKLSLRGLDRKGLEWEVTMHEGRNRQIRRTFEQVGYKIVSLHRVTFGDYNLNKLSSGSYEKINL